MSSRSRGRGMQVLRSAKCVQLEAERMKMPALTFVLQHESEKGYYRWPHAQNALSWGRRHDCNCTESTSVTRRLTSTFFRKALC